MPIASGGAWLSPGTVNIFVQPPGQGFVAFLLTQVSIPSPTRARLDLAESEDFERRWTVPRNPVERIVGQNRIREPDQLTLTGMLSANPLLSPLQPAGLARLDKRQLSQLRTILESNVCFIVSPERPYKDMSCTAFREHYDENTGNGVELTLTFQELRIAIPGLDVSVMDPDALAIGATSSAELGAQTPQATTDPGDFG